MTLEFEWNGERIVLEAAPEGDGYRVRLPGGSEHHIRARRLPDDILQIQEGARTLRVPFARTEQGVELSLAGSAFSFQAASGRPASRPLPRKSGSLAAPMAGVVADVLVVAGQTVEAEQPLVVLEAMKVYATLEAPFAGLVAAVHVRKNERVAHGAPVVDITPQAEEERHE